MCLVLWCVKWIFISYVFLLVFSITLTATLFILTYLTRFIFVGYQYHVKFVLIVSSLMFGFSVILPVIIWRPRDVRNLAFGCRFFIKATSNFDVKLIVRNREILEKKDSAILCMNHQSFMDMWVVSRLSPIVTRSTYLMMKEFIYIFPFGPMAWLAGFEFLDRKSPSSAYKTLIEIGEKLKRDKSQIYIYPEGKRYSEGGILPFKKGAFKTAIQVQVPIIPIVTSPYYFIDHKKKTFTKGRIIVQPLEPISTEGLEIKDSEMLMEKTRNLMVEAYEKLREEVNC